MQPCAERWDAMTPAGPGRHCAACQKVVVDFTQQTDAEILAYLARAGAAPCGRFRAGQLARPLQPSAPPRRWRGWLASALALGGVLGSGRAAAQAGSYFSGGPAPTVASPAGTVPAPDALAAPLPSSPGGSALARGVVTDAASGDRLPGAMVFVKGTTLGATTDARGEFALALTASPGSATLRIAAVGYTTQELPATSTVGAAPAAIKLAVDTHMMGEVVIVGGYTLRKPWPWHPRALYQRAKYLATRPLRRS